MHPMEFFDLLFFILLDVWHLKYNFCVAQLNARREFPDKLHTKSCFPKYQFSVNEAPKPGLRVACCSSETLRFTSGSFCTRK